MSSKNCNNDSEKPLDLQDFKPIRRIDQDSFYLIKLIENIKTGEKFAAKEYMTYKLYNVQCNLFNDERNAYLKLKHPTIVSYIGYSEIKIDEEYKSITITEYIPKSLENLELTNTNKYIILLGVAISLKYMHSQGVIHRNIRPQNIRLDDQLYPHICNFEFSYITDKELTETEMYDNLGTPLYLAPEICSEISYSYKVDVYSFGITMHQLITSQRATKNFKIQDVIEGVRPDINLVQSRKMRDLIERCWSGDPSTRPNFIEIVEEMKSEELQRDFGANQEEISAYLDYLSTQ